MEETKKKVKAISAAAAIKRWNDTKELLQKYESVFNAKNKEIKEMREEITELQHRLKETKDELNHLKKRKREKDLRVMYYLEGE